LATQEKALLNKLEKAEMPIDRLGILNNLVIFYIVKDLDFDKAKALESLMTDPDEIYNLKLELAVCNPSHTAEQRNSMLSDLIEEYPEKRNITAKLLIK
jgi:hypothetical protein